MQNIFFPIETIARELDYRLILAAKTLKKGRRVYIINHRHLHKMLNRFQGGIYVGKHILQSLMPNETWELYRKTKQLGIDVVYLHEEGAIFKGMPDDWKKVMKLQYDPSRFDSNDELCVWGSWQESIHSEQEIDVPVHITGNPRFDLCKEKYRAIYEDQIVELQKKYKSFILINSNYGCANCGLGLEHIFSSRLGYDPSNPEKRHSFVDFYAYSTKSMVDMISLVHRLSTAFPEKTLIYRSHPSEGDLLYKTVFKGLPNVHIIHEGPIGPWLLAAQTIIHDGCTTAIEGSFSSAQIINFKTQDNADHDIRLPNLVGQRATSAEEVIRIIESGNSDSITPQALEELGSMIANYHVDSFDLLADVIDKKAKKMKGSISRAPEFSVLKREYIRSTLSKKWKKMTSSKRRKSRQYVEKKFPGFEMDSIKQKIEISSKITDRKLNLVYSDPLTIVLESAE